MKTINFIKKDLLPLTYTDMQSIKMSPALINWDLICRDYRLSKQIIEKYERYMNWKYIAKYQTLTIPFIKKHKDKMYSELYCKYQRLSEKFIQDNMDDLFLPNVLEYQNLSDELRSKVIEIAICKPFSECMDKEENSQFFQLSRPKFIPLVKPNIPSVFQNTMDHKFTDTYSCGCGEYEGILYYGLKCPKCGNECTKHIL